jgi:PhnB protein
MIVENYLQFDGRCEEAIEFYKRALGAQVENLVRFKDAPKDAQAMFSPGSENKVMHVNLRIGETHVLASDGRNRGQPKFEGFALCLSAANEAEASKLFTALGDGGKVTMPLAKTFFAKSFGTVEDRFGVHWMVIVHPEQAQQRARSTERATA